MNVINKDGTTSSHNNKCCNCKYHLPLYDGNGICEYHSWRTDDDYGCGCWEKTPIFHINNRIRFMDRLFEWHEKYRNVCLIVIYLLFVGMIWIVG